MALLDFGGKVSEFISGQKNRSRLKVGLICDGNIASAAKQSPTNNGGDCFCPAGFAMTSVQLPFLHLCHL